MPLHAYENTEHNLNHLLNSIRLRSDEESPVIFRALTRGYVDPETVRRFGDGSSYFLALHARETGYPEAAEELLLFAVEEEKSPFRVFARLEYLDFLFDHARYRECVSLSRRYLSEEPGIEGILQTRHRTMILTAELLEAFRLGEPDRTGLLFELLTDYPARELPPVLFEGSDIPEIISLRREVEENTGVTTALRGLFSAKTAWFRRSYSAAYRDYADLLRGIREGSADGNPGVGVGVDGSGSAENAGAHMSFGIVTGAVTDEFALSALYSGNSRRAAEIAAALADSIPPDRTELKEARFWILETEGYLLRKLGRFSEAGQRYEEALEIAPDAERERILWYIFDTKFRGSFTEAVRSAGRDALEWSDHSYYNDVLFNLIDRLVYYNRWDLIAELADALEGKVSNVATARAAYIAARAAESGLLDAESSRVDHWFEAAMYNSRGIGSGLYYRIMSAWRLEERGRDLPFDLFDPAAFCSVKNRPAAQKQPGVERQIGTERQIGATRNWSSGASPGDLLIDGFVRFRLEEEAFRRYGDDSVFLKSLSRESVRNWSFALQERRGYLESVRLFNRYCEAMADEVELEEEDVAILYPPAYAEYIDPLAEEYDFPRFLFYALVREESLFDSDIASGAGAVGLSQLMPATAEDVASRIGLEIRDLTDPGTNLRLGAWYLDHLIGRTENYSRALFAYNGGITRVRRWVKDYSSLPGDLLLERIPFAETAHYGRKVLVSSVFYGYFYDKIGYREIIRRFFF